MHPPGTGRSVETASESLTRVIRVTRKEAAQDQRCSPRVTPSAVGVNSRAAANTVCPRAYHSASQCRSDAQWQGERVRLPIEPPGCRTLSVSMRLAAHGRTARARPGPGAAGPVSVYGVWVGVGQHRAVVTSERRRVRSRGCRRGRQSAQWPRTNLTATATTAPATSELDAGEADTSDRSTRTGS